MTKDRWSTVQNLFEAAVSRPPLQRRTFLQEACGGDQELLNNVLSLLNVEVHSLFEGRAVDAVSLPEVLSMDGEKVGPYTIRKWLGAGGMGTVYLAERTDGHFEQTVALKLIKRGMDTETVIRRFESERQILARLEHPHIARLLDGGVSENGRPFFAMEYVEGEPLTDYCNARALSIDARLKLFEDVCTAVSYAHQNLVVHRDLKPSNILVTSDGTVKLLDFGIARMLSGESERAFTQTDTKALTPAYASPEQINQGVITTATDVYGLGVVLYELLVGKKPFHAESREQLLENILKTETLRPSAAIATVRTSGEGGQRKTATPDGTAHLRSTTQEGLQRQLKGDLDTIVLKALQKEPERRYRSAEGLFTDIQAFGANKPISAQPDSFRYRTGKYIRRHRTGVLTTLGVLLLLSTLVGFYTVRLADERDRARTEAEKATEVARFLAEILEEADPLKTPGETLTALELLERGAMRIEEELADQPEVQASMELIMGDVFRNLGNYDRAEPLLRRALATRRDLNPDPNLDVSFSALSLGILLRRAGEFEEAEPLMREAVDLQTRLLGSSDPETAYTKRQLASLLRDQGKFGEAEALYREALRDATLALGDDHPTVTDIKNSLAQLLEATGRFDEAIELVQQIVQTERTASENNPALPGTLSTLTTLLREQGKHEEAETVVREALRITRFIYGDSHVETATSLRTLASILRDKGLYEEAETMYEEALAMRMEAMGPDHPRVANLLNSFAKLKVDQGDYETAETMYREVLRIYDLLPNFDPVRIAAIHHNIAETQLHLGNRPAAEKMYRDSIDLLRNSISADSPDMAYPLFSLGVFLIEEGRHEEAVTVLREAVTIRRDGLPPYHLYTARTEHYLSDALFSLGRTNEARAILEESIARLSEFPDEARILIQQAQERLDALPRE